MRSASTRLYAALASLRERHSKLIGDERERLRRTDLLTYAVTEIKALKLKPGEDDELEKELAILVHHEKLFTLLEEVHGQVAESAGGVLAALRKTRHSMDEILGIDSTLSRPAHQLEDAFYEIEDFAESIRQYKSKADFSPGRLDDVQGRLSSIRTLEKKYGDTIEEVLAYCAAGRAGARRHGELGRGKEDTSRRRSPARKSRSPRRRGSSRRSARRQAWSSRRRSRRSCASWACPR